MAEHRLVISFGRDLRTIYKLKVNIPPYTVNLMKAEVSSIQCYISGVYHGTGIQDLNTYLSNG